MIHDLWQTHPWTRTKAKVIITNYAYQAITMLIPLHKRTTNFSEPSHAMRPQDLSLPHENIQIFWSSIDEILYMALCKQCGIDHKNLTHLGSQQERAKELLLRWFYLRRWVAFAARIPSTIKGHKLTHDMAQP